MKATANAADSDRVGYIIMLKKLTAAVIAASTANILFSADNANLSGTSIVYAEERSRVRPCCYVFSGVACILSPYEAFKGKKRLSREMLIMHDFSVSKTLQSI